MKQDLLEYYSNIYPFQTMVRWLTYNNTKPLIKRELSFEYQNGSVQRYVKFKDAAQMKQRVANSSMTVPRKIDAGAIFSTVPEKDNKGNKPEERQLIFDFDMNDYDDVRNCCQGKKICSLCWKLLRIAIQILTVTLREDFGFEKFMYVFSGGRGVHIWVCDDSALKLKDSGRKSIVDYLELVTGNAKSDSLLADNVLPKEKVIFKNKGDQNQDREYFKNQYLSTTSHPHVQRSLDILEKYFMDIFVEQRALEEQKGQQLIGKILAARSKELKQRVFDRWKRCEKKTEKMYFELVEQVKIYESVKTTEEYFQIRGASRLGRAQRLTMIEQQIRLTFLYPRMDYNVSTMRNHLLKLPFSVHPTSKKISVPMFADKIHQFVPEDALQISDLMKELHDLENDETFTFQGKSNDEIAKSTRLNQYISAMSDFCDRL